MRQDMTGRTAEDHLAQSALGVGALDQEIAAERLGGCQDRLPGAAAIEPDRHRGNCDAVALQAAQEIAALPAGAVAVSRRLLRGHLDAVVRQIDTEVMHFKDRLQSDEARAAFSAFLSRKK